MPDDVSPGGSPAEKPSDPETTEKSLLGEEIDAQDNTGGAEPTLEERFYGKKEEEESPKEGEEEKDESPDADPEKKEEGKDKEEEKDDVEKGPDSYDLKLPEGFDAPEGLMASFKEMAKELKLSNEDAQKMVDLAVKQAQEIDSRNQQVWAAQREAWREELTEDPKYGGKNLEATLRDAARVFRLYGNEAVVEALNAFGLGDHPEFVKMFARIGRAFREDRLVEGEKGAAEPKSPESIFYPNQGKG